jgi:hypothetical protein
MINLNNLTIDDVDAAFLKPEYQDLAQRYREQQRESMLQSLLIDQDEVANAVVDCPGAAFQLTRLLAAIEKLGPVQPHATIRPADSFSVFAAALCLHEEIVNYLSATADRMVRV